MRVFYLNQRLIFSHWFDTIGSFREIRILMWLQGLWNGSYSSKLFQWAAEWSDLQHFWEIR